MARTGKSGRLVKTGSNNYILEGWERRFIASEPRLSEAVEMYESLGLEVRLLPVHKCAEGDECTACFDSERDRIIYTRKRKK